MSSTNGRVGGIYVDLFKTILEPKQAIPGRDPEWGIARIYADAYSLTLDNCFFETWRERLKYWRHQLKDIQNVTDFWIAVNQAVGMDLCPEISQEEHRRIGHFIHEKLTDDTDIYEVREDTLQALAELRELRDRYLIIVATNARNHTVTKMLRHFDIADFFDLRYTAEFLGARKPFPAFWTSMGYWLGQRIGTPRPRVVMIGASLTTDAPAAKLDIPTHLLDRGKDKRALLEGGPEKSGLPEWQHNRYARNLISCYPGPLPLIQAVKEQLTE